MPWKCPVCGHVNPDDKEFCEVCGAKRPENLEIVEAASPEAVKLQESRTEEPAGEQAAQEPSPEQVETATAEAEAVEESAEEKAEEATGVTEEAGEEARAAEKPGEAETAERPAEEKPPETIYLEIINSPAPELIGKKIPVLLKVFPQVSIGRSPENVIILPDPTVSRRHAVIKTEDGKLVLEDLGSTNGTYVYRQESGGFEKVEKVVLEPGMIIRFGEQTIVRVTTEPA